MLSETNRAAARRGLDMVVERPKPRADARGYGRVVRPPRRVVDRGELGVFAAADAVKIANDYDNDYDNEKLRPLAA